MIAYLTLCFCFAVLSVCAQFGTVSISVNMGEGDGINGINSKVVNESFFSGCPAGSSCMPISNCPLLHDLYYVACFASDRYFHRFNQLTCGHFYEEDYVCCPSCDCGLVYQRNAEQCGRGMVHGAEGGGLGAQPWVARIGFTHKDTGNVRFACSGSIISPRIILTAAHCALAKPEGYKLSTVVVGEWDVGRSPDCNDFFCAPPAQAIKVDRVVVHSGYEQKVFRHDIALVVLREDIKYTVAAAPICLSESPEVVLNERATLVGWGKLSGQSNFVSLQQILEVPLVPLETCERIFGDSVPIHEGQLCAGGEEGKDACSGFGGAPLLISRDGKHMQVGIVSFGSENCGSEGVPSVYTNVAHYRTWIRENSPT